MRFFINGNVTHNRSNHQNEEQPKQIMHASMNGLGKRPESAIGSWGNVVQLMDVLRELLLKQVPRHVRR